MTVQPRPGPSGQFGLLQLPGREDHLLSRVAIGEEWIAINGGVGEAVIDTKLLQLSIGLQQRPAVPQTDVVDGAGCRLQIGAGEIGTQIIRAEADAIQLEGASGRCDRLLQVRHLQRQFLGSQQQPAGQRGDKLLDQHGDHQQHQQQTRHAPAETIVSAGDHSNGQEQQQQRDQAAERQGQMNLQPAGTGDHAGLRPEELMA